MRRGLTQPILAALALCSAVLLSACGGSSSPAASDVTNTPTAPAATSAPPSAAATAPADVASATAEIKANWTKFFASSTSASVAKGLLEDGDALGPALAKAQQEDKQTGGQRAADVKKVEFTSPTQATVFYKLHAGGALLDSSGVAVLVDGTWKVSKITFCTLVQLGNNNKPVASCG